MAKLSGVEIIIIIGVGFAVFVILFIVAHRQIARFKVRDLLSRPLMKHSQFGASSAYVAHIRGKIAEIVDIDVQPQMWEDHWLQYVRDYSPEKSPSAVPSYVYRAKAMDCTVLLKLELVKFDEKFNWIAFEDLGEYFDRLKLESPISRLPVETVMEFVQLYRRCRWGDAEFIEKDYNAMCALVSELLECLRNLRHSSNQVEPSFGPLVNSAESLDKDTRDKDKFAPKKFPRGYEPLHSDGSTAGSMLIKKGAGRSLARLKRGAEQRKAKPLKGEASWEEQVPLQMFHDNPLISFESAPASSKPSREKMA